MFPIAFFIVAIGIALPAGAYAIQPIAKDVGMSDPKSPSPPSEGRNPADAPAKAAVPDDAPYGAGYEVRRRANSESGGTFGTGGFGRGDIGGMGSGFGGFRSRGGRGR